MYYNVFFGAVRNRLGSFEVGICKQKMVFLHFGKIRSRNAHINFSIIIFFFCNKKYFSANNCFMKNSAFLRNPFFCYSAAYCHQSVYLGQKRGQSHCELNKRTWWKFWLFFLSLLIFYLDHEKFDESTTRETIYIYIGFLNGDPLKSRQRGGKKREGEMKIPYWKRFWKNLHNIKARQLVLFLHNSQKVYYQ